MKKTISYLDVKQTQNERKLAALSILRAAIDYSETGCCRKGCWILGQKEIDAVKIAINELDSSNSNDEHFSIDKSQALEILCDAIGYQDRKNEGRWALSPKSIEAILIAIEELSKKK